MKKLIAIVFAFSALAICIYVAIQELSSKSPNLTDLANLIVLTLTLVVLIWYAYDTNTIAKITLDKWIREGILGTTYEIKMPDASVGDSGLTFFSLTNSTTQLIRANVNLNLKVYNNHVSAEALLDGSNNWLVYPLQTSKLSFEIETLLKKVGKSVKELQAETTTENRKNQLTMVLELTFTDEFATKRTLPARPHHFDFKDWVWIPRLGEN